MSVEDHGLNALRKSAEKEFPPSNAEHVLKVKVKNTDSEKIPVDADVVFSGLKTALATTIQNVTSTASTLPGTALTGRNSLSVVNLDDTETLYIGNSDVEANRTVGGKGGWEVGPLESFNLDITDNISIYGITESGKTVLVKILELA